MAQRVSTIINADQILVLEDGATVGPGPTASSWRRARPDAEIIESQRTEEAVAAWRRLDRPRRVPADSTQ